MSKVTNGALGLQPGAVDKTKDWQLELLMEKIRSKGAQFKGFGEISKNVRMAMLDKRYALDSIEKSQHQKCLDTLQHSIKVTSLQSMIERLESLTRQLGLKFMVSPSGLELFISSDMFYLEINLDQTGAVRDVKVNHEGKVEPQSCSELVNCLSKGDFDDFTAQLEGFASIYQLNAEKKIKCKAFCALQSLESDLSTLAQLQTFMKEPFNLLHKSPVGILEKRRGGHPMKLTYFVSPYDLIDTEKCDIDTISVETVTAKSLGYSVTVCMEGSAAHKLQTTTLITVNRNQNGKNSPSFACLSGQNSAAIPACFVLRLNKPMPMCVVLIRQLQQLTELDVTDLTTTHALLSLIATHSSDGKLDSGSMKGMFVTLPDQHHCYFMTEHKNMEGLLMNQIPFTHPGHVSQILVILRQQALFNTIISSCVRPNSKQDFENMIMFEVSALSWTHISISMEHPIEESMATAEIDLSDISNLVCRIHTPGTPPPQNTPDTVSELATKVLNRCFSIPVTMRAVIHLWDKQAVRKNHFNGSENFNLALGSGDPGGSGGRGGGALTDFGGLDMKIKQEPGSNGSMTGGMNLPIMAHPHQGIFLNESIMASANFPNFQATDGSASMLTNMELTNILAGTSSSNEKSSSASSSSTKGQHKRKASEDSWKGSASKRKPGDDPDMLLETSSSDSTSRSTPLSQETVSEIPTPNSALGFHSDLDFPNLDPTELIGSSSDKNNSEYENVDDLGDVEEILASTAREHKVRKPQEKSPLMGPIILSELAENKSIISPTVSITPIQSSPSPLGFQQANSAHERRTSIEIIPLVTTNPSTMPTSITITPITSSQPKSEERSRDKKSSKSRSEDKNKFEKKRKRKREESPMGPPEKVPVKQDPLTKPISVSIKPAESPPLSITPTSPSMIRKLTASPTHNRSLSNLSGKLSPNLKGGLKTGSSHHSPKHSPAHVSSSPKHSIPGISSPKNHGASPKHPSTSGSGKPSMSTLKNAANSPSSKSSSSGDSKSKSSSKDSSRDKDKKVSNFSANNKVKSSSVKLKQLELNTNIDTSGSSQEGLPSPSGTMDLSKSANLNQVRNRKGMLSAIVDKLKSTAAHCDIATDLSSKSSNRERTGQSNSGKSSDGSKSTNKVGETKNSEYMVKPSSDGIKITINKTRTKDSSKSTLSKSSTSGTGSPKTHTGLKPGVNSGPASKKPQQINQKSTSSGNMNNSTGPPGYPNFKSSGGSNKTSGSIKSSSMTGGLSKSISKLSSSPKTSSSATDLSRNKDRPKLNKSGSEKSIFSSRDGRKSSPTQNNKEEMDGERALKLALSKMESYTSPLTMDGLMKQLDKNFQIPKLSARTSEDKKISSSKTTTSDGMNNINRTVDTSKMFDMLPKNDISLPKYQLPLPTSKIFDGGMEAKIRNSLNASPANSILTGRSASPKLPPKDTTDLTMDPSDDKKRDAQILQGPAADKDFKLGAYPISAANKHFSGGSGSNPPEPLSLSTKSVDLTSKFATPTVPKDEKKDQANKIKAESGGGDMLLDFSRSNKSDKVGGPTYPPSPSVSLLLPFPPVGASPRSASSCVTDDEPMDEAPIGMEQ